MEHVLDYGQNGNVIFNRKVIEIFRYGTDRQILNLLNKLDLGDIDILQEVFYASAVYGRLPILKRLWAKFGHVQGINGIMVEVFLTAAVNDDFNILEWVWDVYPIDKFTVEKAIELIRDREIKEWLIDEVWSHFNGM